MKQHIFLHIPKTAGSALRKLLGREYGVRYQRTPNAVAHPEHAEFELRFDAILIAPRRLPRHLLAAFDAST